MGHINRSTDRQVDDKERDKQTDDGKWGGREEGEGEDKSD